MVDKRTKAPSIISDDKSKAQSHHSAPPRTATIRQTDGGAGRCAGARTPRTAAGARTGKAARTSSAVLWNVKRGGPTGPHNCTPRSAPEELKSYVQTKPHMRMSTGAFTHSSQKVDTTRMPIDRWMDKILYSHLMGDYSAIKWNELLIYAITCTRL